MALILREPPSMPANRHVGDAGIAALARRVLGAAQGLGPRGPRPQRAAVGGHGDWRLSTLLIAAAAERFQPVALLRLLKHLCAAPASMRAPRADGTRALELAVFRAPYLGGSLADIVAALERAAKAHVARRAPRPGGAPNRGGTLGRRRASCWQASRRSCGRSRRCLLRPGAQPCQCWPRRMCGRRKRAGRRPWRGEPRRALAGRWGRRVCSDCLPAFSTPAWPMRPELAAADYPEFYRGLLSDQTIACRGRGTPGSPSWGPSRPACNSPISSILGSPQRRQLATGGRPQGRGSIAGDAPSARSAGAGSAHRRRGGARLCPLLGAEEVYLTRALARPEGAPDRAIALAHPLAGPHQGSRARRHRKAQLPASPGPN